MGEEKNWKLHDILATNEVVADRFKVIHKISQGGFGQVYEVEYIKKGNLLYDNNLKVGTRLAMKVESKQLSRTILKSESEIMRKFASSKYFYTCYDFGEGPKFFYMVQTLGGMDLSRFIKSRPNRSLTFETTFRLATLMIEPVEQFHNRGYIHRDVKLNNFIIQLRTFEYPVRIMLIDFGVVKRVTRADGQLKSPQEAGKGKYQGTYFYSSIRCLQLEEPWKNDDLISLYYSYVRMLNRHAIPWGNIKDKAELLEKKKNTSISSLHKTFPLEVQKTLKHYYDHLVVLKYGEEPDYEYLKSLFQNILELWGVKETDPFEWERKGEEMLNSQEDALKNLLSKNMKVSSYAKPHVNNGNIGENNVVEENWINKKFINRFICGKGIV